MTIKPAQPVAIVPPGPMETPTFPLSPEKRASYQALFNLYQATLDGTADPVVFTAINPSYLDVGHLLTKDHIYTLDQTTALFNDLKEQFEVTNIGLVQLASEIAATSTHFTQAATILSAINMAVPYIAAL